VLFNSCKWVTSVLLLLLVTGVLLLLRVTGVLLLLLLVTSTVPLAIACSSPLR
jgi:hypothetical protein